LTRAKFCRAALSTVAVTATAGWTAGCTAAFGPGYDIVSQEISVQFVPSPQPALRISAEYQLRNTGNQPLSSIEVRLPAGRRFRYANSQALWDGTALSLDTSPSGPRDVLLNFPQPWKISTSHKLRLSGEFLPAQEGESALTFASDAFFLPAQGWSPELLPSRGPFGTGGVPPKSWKLVVRAPSGFLIHTSGKTLGGRPKASLKSGEQTVTVVQQPKDAYPFVIAGNYSSAQQNIGGETVNLWTRSPQKPDALRDPSAVLVRAIRAYDKMFGRRARDSHQLWIVECPVVSGCFTSAASNYAGLVFETSQKPSAELASLDTVMADLSGGAPVMPAVAPSLASTWLGYDQNPGFFQQTPPLSALPAFAAARGREAVEGPQVRVEIIARGLRALPAPSSTPQKDDDPTLRIKSFLFFYALQDRYGPDTFDKAISHMLYARAGRGFSLDDLIAALEMETHQNVAAFVRSWMKHPGIPHEFRSRYETPSAKISPSEESAL
jgi:hypothetical protein